MKIFNFSYKKWTQDELVAYFKTLMELSLSDGNFDKEEKKTLVQNMREIGWNPTNQNDLDNMQQKATNMSVNQQHSILKALSASKKSAVAIGLKLIITADKEIAQSELDYVKKLIIKTNLPEINFTKHDFEKYSFNKTVEVNKIKPFKGDFNNEAIQLFNGFEKNIKNQNHLPYPPSQWYEILKARGESMQRFSMGKNIKEVENDWVYSHIEEYNMKHEESTYEEVEEAMLIRIERFGFIYDCMVDLKKDLESLTREHNITNNPFLGQFYWDLAAAKSSLDSCIKFAELNKVDSNLIKKQYNKYKISKSETKSSESVENGWQVNKNSEGIITNKKYFKNGELEKDSVSKENMQEFLLDIFAIMQIGYVATDDDPKIDVWKERYAEITDQKSCLDFMERLCWKWINSGINSATIWNELAYFHYHKNEVKQGLYYALKSIEQEEATGGNFDTVGEGYFMLEDFEMALSFFSNAVEIDIENDDFRADHVMNKVNTLLNLNKTSEAKEELNYLLEKDPNNEEANSLLESID
jgi:tetratricopeptide (TPR) repeat protein